MGQRARWVLPETVDPGVYQCWSVKVPDDINHVAAFKGAVYELTRANNWENDELHTAKDVADVWKQQFLDMSVCTVACPTFYAYNNDINCPNIVDLRTIRVMNECDGCTSVERSYFCRSIIDVISGVARIGLNFATLIDDTDCGVHICQIRAYQTGVGSPTWELQWRDCLDNDHLVTDTSGDEFVYNDIEAKWVCLSLNSNFCSCISVDGEALCLSV
jgi:hypothetical protein